MNSRINQELENLTIQDLGYAKVLGWTEKEILNMDYFQTKRKLENMFSEMIHQWFKGNKPNITLKEAEELDEKYQEIKYKWAETSEDEFTGMGDAIVRFSAIPKDDYSIVFYMGYPFDSEICKWAEKMIKKDN